MKKLRGVLIDVNATDPKVIEIEDRLENFYDILNCHCIDIVTRKIGNVPFDIICDDNGLLKENPILTGMSFDEQSHLFGNLLIVGLADSEGNLTSLSAADIKKIGHYMWTTKEAKNVNNVVLRFDL